MQKLTSSQICGNMCWAADNCKEPSCSGPDRGVDLDSDGGAGEGAGGLKAAVTLGRCAVIDLNPVRVARFNIRTRCINIEAVEGEGDCLSIGWLHLPSLKQLIHSVWQGKHQDQIAITWS